ncbi:MAG TPA: hypothetical protein VGF81_11725 [Solirubrobacteraceae bacterium]|jgi:hypothetical protein
MLRRLFARPGPLVYGTMVVGAVMDAEGIKTETFPETIFGIGLAMVLLWLAHSYASLTGHRLSEGEHLTTKLLGHHLAHEAPILLGAVIPLLTVIIWSATGASLSESLSAGIWADVAMIVIINLVAAFVTELRGRDLIVQTAVGVVLGLGIIFVKLIFH